MIENDELYDLTERYLSGTLSEKEHSEFKNRMEKDPELRSFTEKIQEVNELLFMEGLRNELPSIKKAEEKYVFQERLKIYGKWLGGIVIVSTVASLVWMKMDSKAIKDDTSIAVKRENGKDETLPMTILSEHKSEIKQSGKSIVNVPTLKNEEKEVVETKELGIKNEPKSSSEVLSKDHKEEIQNEQLDPIAFPCKESIIGIFESTNTCENKNNGSIVLRSVSGGTKPYSISFNNKPFHETSSIQFLYGGDYSLVIRDSKGCFSENYNISIVEKPCSASMDYVFSYPINSEWVFPEIAEKDFVLYVYNSGGGIVFSVPVSNGVPSSWNGYTNQGQKLPLGLYTFRFVQSEHIIIQGTITVVD